MPKINSRYYVDINIDNNEPFLIYPENKNNNRMKVKRQRHFAYIIVKSDNPDWFWSEEEGGRFTSGAINEKFFRTKKECKQYIKKNKMKDVEPEKMKHNWD